MITNPVMTNLLDFLSWINYIVCMRKPFFRIISILTLIAAFAMFTGLSENAFAEHSLDNEKSCYDYDECSAEEGQSPVQNSTSYCPFFLCLSVNVVSPFIPFISTKAVHTSQTTTRIFLESPPKSIFHPPAVV